MRDPDVYDRFERVVLVHGCREVAELAYGEEVVARLLDDADCWPTPCAASCCTIPTTTREAFRNQGRVTTLLDTAKLTGRSRPAADRPGRTTA